MISRHQLIQAERDREVAIRALTKMARDIAAMRCGNPINEGYGLHAHSFGKAGVVCAGDYDSDDVVSYPDDLEVIRVELYNRRWESEIIVTFPAEYLNGTDQYLDLETRAINDRRIARERAQAEQADREAMETLVGRRQAYERLRIEIEGDPQIAEQRQQMIDLARETIAGHPDPKAPGSQMLAWLASRAEIHARAVLALAGEV